MDHPLKSTRGQALVEATLVVPIIIICVSLGIAYVFAIKAKFKHDYVQESQIEDTQNDLVTQLKNAGLGPDPLKGAQIVYMPKKTSMERLDELKDAGWEFKNQLKVGRATLYFLTNGNKHMTFDGHFGVINVEKMP